MLLSLLAKDVGNTLDIKYTEMFLSLLAKDVVNTLDINYTEMLLSLLAKIILQQCPLLHLGQDHILHCIVTLHVRILPRCHVSLILTVISFKKCNKERN